MKALRIYTITAAFLLLLSACNKKGYYIDGGTEDGTYKGTIMQYLESRPDVFAQLVDVIKYAGMETVLSSEEVTFFAPADSSIRRTLEITNLLIPFAGKPVITKITDVKPEIWRKYLSRYVFKGSKSLSDYPQIDIGNLSAYSGQMYASYDGVPMNVGVNFTDANGVKYAGYRYLLISLVNSATPRDYTTWWSAFVASSNIKASNGYIHALQFDIHEFGFRSLDFANDLIYNN
ncbi:fasciclin domain-containing protein [Niabella yanshanensis]|uniref:Fasciclin domain-containing protein n=1 Tax=Niabella yanshanensis TaxID=577386 RepID=A0ABZ0W9N9_9BACT|nr:fasciclin domain-containing protein [Niabella yanshanensis]WQD39856.1 fasciclin domain-containing protein [Niabella yanshanensis]